MPASGADGVAAVAKIEATKVLDNMKRHTVVVEGTLSFGMQRVAAARAGDHGRDVVTLPLLAARLAGGFSRLAVHATLVPIVARALAELTFEELEAVKLDQAWREPCLRAWSVCGPQTFNSMIRVMPAPA